jgi:hypothetical protein
MIYEVKIDDNNEAGKKALQLLKELHIPVQPMSNLLPEQILLIEKSLKEIEEGKTFTHEQVMKQAEEWLNEK